MITSIVDLMFGCWHKNYSFPINRRNRRSATSGQTGTYVVCLDCGKEFAYDWEEMKVVPIKEGKASAVAKTAAAA